MTKPAKCPWFKKPCIGHDCVQFVNIQGTHPQTGQKIDQWDCAIRWLPLLLVENSMQQRHTAGEVSAFRSEMRQDNVALAQVLLSKQVEQEEEQHELKLVTESQDQPRGH
jgi:hypothetical protein